MSQEREDEFGLVGQDTEGDLIEPSFNAAFTSPDNRLTLCEIICIFFDLYIIFVLLIVNSSILYNSIAKSLRSCNVK